MTTLFQHFKNTPEQEFPEHLHKAIMKELRLSKYKNPMRNALVLLTATLAFSGWNIWSRIVEIQGLALMKDLVSGFRMDSIWIADFAKTIVQIYPVELILIFLANMLAVAYLGYLLQKIKKPAAVNM